MIGNILKNMRLASGLSQRKLGEKLHLADTTISRYERENSQPDFDTILKISKICRFEILLKDPNNKIINIGNEKFYNKI